MNTVIAIRNTGSPRIFDLVRSHRRQWGLALVVMLLASWLSIYCTNCFAVAETTSHHEIQSAGSDSHCMDPSHSPGGNEKDRKASGACCSIAIAAASPKSADIRANLFKILFYVKYSISGNELDHLNNIHVALDVVPAYKKPERAYFLPFARYTVLLN